MSNTDQVKCVVVGDASVGKTCLLISYANNRFPDQYVPTIFDSYKVMVPVGNVNIELNLWDTAGHEGYEELRKITYKDVDVYLLCFSVDNMVSFINIRQRWFDDIKKHDPKSKIILVATKIDLRTNQERILKLRSQNMAMVSHEAAIRLASDLKVDYMECSALTKENVQDVFCEVLMKGLSGDDDTSVKEKWDLKGYFLNLWKKIKSIKYTKIMGCLKRK